MNRRRVAVASVGSLLFLTLAIVPAVPRESTSNPSDVSLATTAADTFVLGSWTFDDGVGGPDLEGWTSVDKTEQSGTFFHIDDFVGLPLPYAPLEGAKSLWCGTRSWGSCNVSGTPGTGHHWRQYFETAAPFATTGDATVSYLVRWDSEAAYDQTFVEYFSKTGEWREIVMYEGVGQTLASHVIPADSLDGNLSLRFRFFSDFSWDDEDNLRNGSGAIELDSLRIADATGTIDFQDFEAEAVGALVTADGDWVCHPEYPFGDFAGLFDGSTVVQEDSLITNNTYLWGFFNGSTADYSCGGHPGQAAVPVTNNPGSNDPDDYIHNEVWSPWVEFTEDVGGNYIPSNSNLIFAFDVYRDLPLDNAVYYTFRVRFLVDGCPSRWWDIDEFWWGEDKDWHRKHADFTGFIDNDATHVQLSLAVGDWCSLYCGISSTGDCHSHAPLFDNVEVYRVLDPASSANDTPSLATSLDQNYPNPFNPSTTIRYSIDAPGRVTLAVYNVAGQRIRTLVDERQSPRTAGFEIQWDGTNDFGRVVSTGIYFYRLEAGAFSQTRKMVLLK